MNQMMLEPSMRWRVHVDMKLLRMGRVEWKEESCPVDSVMESNEEACRFFQAWLGGYRAHWSGTLYRCKRVPRHIAVLYE